MPSIVGSYEANYVVGTPGVIAPECSQGELATPLSDLYSLAVTLFATVVGHYPYKGDTDIQTLYFHAYKEVPSAREKCPAVGEGLDKFIQRGMSKNPMDRPLSAEEFRYEFVRALEVDAKKTS